MRHLQSLRAPSSGTAPARPWFHDWSRTCCQSRPPREAEPTQASEQTEEVCKESAPGVWGAGKSKVRGAGGRLETWGQGTPACV